MRARIGLSISGQWIRISVLFVVSVAVVAIADRPARAQVTTGDVLGTVTDQSGAVIPGAKITLTNLATGIKATAKSNEAGDYVFNLLPPGHYSVAIEATGFKKVVYGDVALAAGDRAREDGKMQAGSVEETVEVTAAPPLLQTDSSAVSSVVTEQSVQDLPLNGRNFVNLAQIQPGVNEGPPNAISSGTRPDDRRETSTLSANGQSDLFNNEMIDGMDNNEREQGFLGVRPSIDAIAEVKVDTNSFSAEFGRDAGAVVNVITKSGTNQLHGTAYEFFRNDLFDARDYFTTVAAVPEKPEYRENQFGGSAGGPIFKNRTFFFGDAEDNRVIQAQPTGLLTVPTAQEHPSNGFVDFSDNGGSVLPTSILSPVGLNYLGLFPLPNTGGAGAIVNNYVAAPNKTQFAFTADGRIDENFKNGDTLFGRYSYNNVNTYIPGAFPAVQEEGLEIQPGGATFNFAGPSITKTHGVQLNYVHLFTPNLVMELKTGYARIEIDTLPANDGTDASSALGVVNANTPDAIETTGLMPLDFATGGYAGLGDAPFLPILDRNNTFQYMGALTYTHGKHDIKTGAQFTRRQLNYFQNPFPLGFVLFYGLSGNSVQDMLLGLPLGLIRENTLIEPGFRVWESGGYIQDDWRLSQALTLNLGLRYDVYGAITEAHNRYENFEYPTLTMISGTQDAHVGVDTNYKNFEPRVGFAYSAGKGMVVRGGYGISSYPLAIQNEIQIPNPPYTFYEDCIPCFGNFNWPTMPIPTPASLTNLSGSLTYVAKNYNTLDVQQFNLMVQKELGANVITLGGVGELGRHLLFQPSINMPVPSGPYADDATQGPAAPPALLTASALPNVGTIEGDLPWATNNYYAMQAVFARRFTKGLAFNANYTWAHGLGDAVAGSGAGTAIGMIPSDVRADYGNSGVDIRHRIAGNITYSLPFGQNLSGARALAIKGWDWNFLMFWQTGQPFGITNGYANPNGLAQINLPTITADRPNRIAGQSFKTSSSPGLADWLNPGAFTPQPAGTLGDEGNNPFQGPHTRRADMSVLKNFNLSERVSAQFRAECYNISNTPNFENPNSAISGWTAGPQHGAANPISEVGLLPGDIATTAGGFGSITSDVPNLNPRQFQFALKFLF